MNQSFVRATEIRDEARWWELWNGYCAFYKMELTEETTSYLWTRIMASKSSVSSIVFEKNGTILGIANYVIHESTSTIKPICCLQDLFVDPSARKQGVGKALIDWLLTEMKMRNWSRVNWHTRENNYNARALYDKFTNLSDFKRYVVNNPAN